MAYVLYGAERGSTEPRISTRRSDLRGLGVLGSLSPGDYANIAAAVNFWGVPRDPWNDPPYWFKRDVIQRGHSEARRLGGILQTADIVLQVYAGLPVNPKGSGMRASEEGTWAGGKAPPAIWEQPVGEPKLPAVQAQGVAGLGDWPRGRRFNRYLSGLGVDTAQVTQAAGAAGVLVKAGAGLTTTGVLAPIGAAIGVVGAIAGALGAFGAGNKAQREARKAKNMSYGAKRFNTYMEKLGSTYATLFTVLDELGVPIMEEAEEQWWAWYTSYRAGFLAKGNMAYRQPMVNMNLHLHACVDRLREVQQRLLQIEAQRAAARTAPAATTPTTPMPAPGVPIPPPAPAVEPVVAGAPAAPNIPYSAGFGPTVAPSGGVYYPAVERVAPAAEQASAVTAAPAEGKKSSGAALMAVAAAAALLLSR